MDKTKTNNEYQAYLMQHPSPPDTGFCAICGRPATNLHHIVPRSQGGTAGPVVRLCGSGTMGHHGMAENKQIHFRFCQFTNDPEVGQWEYFKWGKPISYEDALEHHYGWNALYDDGYIL